MAEPFGIVSGAISVASAFTACVDCFEYVQFGRHFGREFQMSKLALDCARLRLTRWGESVNIYDDPKLGRTDATMGEIQLVKDALLQVLVLFANTESNSRNYQLTAEAGEDLSSYSTGDLSPEMAMLSNKMKDLAIQRQKKGGFLKLASWALYDKPALTDLVARIVALMDGIETLFPAVETQLLLVQREIVAIGDKQSLVLVEGAAAGVDSLLQNAAKEVIAGHHYSNIEIAGHAQTGDAYGSDWNRGAIGASHHYNGVEVYHRGRALIGNKYGGKDFWA